MESIQYGLFLLGAIVCAYRAIVSKKILSATIYLACISALVSAVLYLFMSGQRWKAVERAVADALNEHLAAPNFTPIERIPLLGREGPDLTVNETGLVINVKSRAEIPDRLFPKQNELLFIGALVCFRLDSMSR